MKKLTKIDCDKKNTIERFVENCECYNCHEMFCKGSADSTLSGNNAQTWFGVRMYS